MKNTCPMQWYLGLKNSGHSNLLLYLRIWKSLGMCIIQFGIQVALLIHLMYSNFHQIFLQNLAQLFLRQLLHQDLLLDLAVGVVAVAVLEAVEPNLSPMNR